MNFLVSIIIVYIFIVLIVIIVVILYINIVFVSERVLVKRGIRFFNSKCGEYV